MSWGNAWAASPDAWPGGGIAVIDGMTAYGALFDQIWKTTDGGAGWTLLPYNQHSADEHPACPSLRMTSELEGWIASYHYGEVHHTTDGWQTAETFPVNIGELTYSPQVIYAFGSTLWVCDTWMGFTLRSTNGGADWTLVNTPADDNYAKDFYAVSATEAWLCWKEGWDENYESVVHMEHTTNGGADWTDTVWSGVNDLTYVDGFGDLIVVTPWLGDNGTGAGKHWHLKVSTNGGASWTDRQLEKPVIGGEYPNTIWGISVAEEGSIFLSSEDGVVFRSADAGATWETLAGPSIYNGYLLQIDAGFGLVVAGSNGDVVTNGGLEFYGENVLINGGACVVFDPAVTLTLNPGTLAATEMAIRNDEDGYGAWEAFAATKAWTLSAACKVWAKFRDGA